MMHAGCLLLKNILEPHGGSLQDLANFTKLELDYLQRFVDGVLPVTHDIDNALHEAFNFKRGHWLNYQKKFDNYIEKKLSTYFESFKQDKCCQSLSAYTILQHLKMR